MQTDRSWARGETKNDYLYNGGTELNSNTGWYETFYRSYDPALGRFHQIDPLAGASALHSPYNYGYNNPINFNDPMGDRPPEVMRDIETSGGIGGPGVSFSSGDGFTWGASNGSIFSRGGQNWNPSYPGSGGFMGAGSFISSALGSMHGGSWSDGQATFYTNPTQGYDAGVAYNNHHDSWHGTWPGF